MVFYGYNSKKYSYKKVQSFIIKWKSFVFAHLVVDEQLLQDKLKLAYYYF